MNLDNNNSTVFCSENTFFFCFRKVNLSGDLRPEVWHSILRKLKVTRDVIHEEDNFCGQEASFHFTAC